MLCLDTCIILDIMRDPTRDNASSADRVAALWLLSAMEAKNNLVGLLAAQVTIEFGEHVRPVEEEAERALSKLRDRLKRIDAINVALGGSGSTDVSHYGDYVSRSKSIAERFVAAAAPVPQSDETTARAFKRLNEARTPASKGKQSMKDCVVIETYLDAVVELRKAGLKSPIVFASSNIKDYAGETGTVLRPDLAAEFAALDMEYAPNLSAAKHYLGL
ncbi:MAG: PIN domain-containing protein [Pseudomonadota bacterium]